MTNRNLKAYTNKDIACFQIAFYVVNLIQKHDFTKHKFFTMCLPTGRTPEGVYKYLVEFYQKGLVSFKNVRTINLDEYDGISKNHKQSYHHYMYNKFFGLVDIDVKNTYFPGEGFKDFDQIDICLLGVGDNGHIAFVEPIDDNDLKTTDQSFFENSVEKQVVLTKETIEQNAVLFGGDKSKVPKKAISLGLQEISKSKEIILMAFGQSKLIPVTSILTSFGVDSENFDKRQVFCKFPCTYLSMFQGPLTIVVDPWSFHNHLFEMKYDMPLVTNVDKILIPKGKILVLAAHPDDEVIDLGGFLHSHLEKENVYFYYMTLGSKISQRMDRLKEAISGLLTLGYGKKTLENKVNANIGEISELFNNLQKQIDIIDPDYIFVTGDADPNGTHFKCLDALAKCTLSKKAKVALTKGAWTNSFMQKNSVFIPFSAESFQKKCEAFQCHESQNVTPPTVTSPNDKRGFLQRIKEDKILVNNIYYEQVFFTK